MKLNTTDDGKSKLEDLNIYTITLDSQCFADADRYHKARESLISISPKMQCSADIVNERELFRATVDPKFVDSKAEYYELLSKINELLPTLN